MQRRFPERFEGLVLFGALALPVAAHQFVTGLSGVTGEQSDHFVRRMVIVQRRNQGLNDSDGAVEGAAIAPGFQRMGGGGVPMAKLGGFILVQAGVNAQLCFLERRRKIKIGRRVVHGIAAEDDQEVHVAGVQIIDEVAKRFELVNRAHFD